MCPFHDSDETRASWPFIVRTFFSCVVSHNCVSLLSRPMAR